jgi:hypothetical protein
VTGRDADADAMAESGRRISLIQQRGVPGGATT